MQREVIDISAWQHPNQAPIDWPAVAADGVIGVIIKATQGLHYVNPFYLNDARGAHQAGLMVGAYHFAEPGASAPTDQAAHFHATIMGVPITLGLWLDLETTGGLAVYELTQWYHGWLTAVDSPPAPAGLYVNLDYANQLGDVHTVSHLWLANPSAIENDYRPVLTQYGQNIITGITGNVDRDHLETDRWVNPPGPPPPSPPTPPPAPPPPPDPGQQDLQQGATGAAVAEVQAALNRWGAHLVVDGVFGPLTDGAVVSFQTEHGLTVDGIVGPLTWAQLAAPASGAPLGPGLAAEPQIAQGVTGTPVRLLQRLLNDHGLHLVVDGIFGPLTHNAVTAFQGEHGLVVDGIVGPHTWAALAG